MFCLSAVLIFNDRANDLFIRGIRDDLEQDCNGESNGLMLDKETFETSVFYHTLATQHAAYFEKVNQESGGESKADGQLRPSCSMQ